MTLVLVDAGILRTLRRGFFERKLTAGRRAIPAITHLAHAGHQPEIPSMMRLMTLVTIRRSKRIRIALEIREEPRKLVLNAEAAGDAESEIVHELGGHRDLRV